MTTHEKKRCRWVEALGIVLLISIIACSKKHDDAATTNAGGGVATQRSVITMQGDAR